MNNRTSVSSIFFRLLLLIWGLTILFPLVWVGYTSLKSNQEFFSSAWALPEVLQFSNYIRAFNQLGIAEGLLNTAYYVLVALVIGVSISTVATYALVRMEWKGKKLVSAIVMASLFLPGVNALIPQYVLMCKFHLNNSLNGLIFLSSICLGAFDLLILGGFMQTIPKELEESAAMDGANIAHIIKNIIVPLSIPGIFTISIFKFIGLYNDFMGPFIYLTDSRKHTISLKMYYANQMMQYKSDWVALMAGLVISMVPLIIAYMFLQRYIVEGATMGAVKA